MGWTLWLALLLVLIRFIYASRHDTMFSIILLLGLIAWPWLTSVTQVSMVCFAAGLDNLALAVHYEMMPLSATDFVRLCALGSAGKSVCKITLYQYV